MASPKQIEAQESSEVAVCHLPQAVVVPRATLAPLGGNAKVVEYPSVLLGMVVSNVLPGPVKLCLPFCGPRHNTWP
jgi:hypothetical protein